MKSFKDYDKEVAKVAETQNADAQTTASAEELTRKIAAAYHGKSNMSMLQSILAEAEKSKRAGTLSNEEIEHFYQSFAPMLDNVQRRRLRAVVDRLKSI
ncbi:MAG: hypothetical protein IJX49_05580 [Clostridia bacterium]|nr:hypothetical protein [Clostridia bacterium]